MGLSAICRCSAIYWRICAGVRSRFASWMKSTNLSGVLWKSGLNFLKSAIACCLMAGSFSAYGFGMSIVPLSSTWLWLVLCHLSTVWTGFEAPPGIAFKGALPPSLNRSTRRINRAECHETPSFGAAIVLALCMERSSTKEAILNRADYSILHILARPLWHVPDFLIYSNETKSGTRHL